MPRLFKKNKPPASRWLYIQPECYVSPLLMLFDMKFLPRIDGGSIIELVDVQQSFKTHVMPFGDDERAVAGLHQISRFGDHFLFRCGFFLAGGYQKHLPDAQLA